MSEDSIVMGWLWHSMESQVATKVEFCDSSNKIWDSIAEYFSHQNNVSWVYEIYKRIFNTEQSGKILSEYYSTLKIGGINYCSIDPLLLIWNNRSIIRKNF